MNANDIGWAVQQMRDGKRVRRAGWNGKGMYLFLVPAHGYYVASEELKLPLALAPWVGMKTADGLIVPWLCSQTDLLAGDWGFVDE